MDVTRPPKMTMAVGSTISYPGTSPMITRGTRPRPAVAARHQNRCKPSASCSTRREPHSQSERLVVNIADHMRPRLENDLPSCDRALDRSLDNHLIGRNCSFDESPPRDYERLAAQFALNLSIEFHQALGGDAPFNLQSFGDDRFASRPEHDPMHSNCPYQREKKRGA